MFKILVLEFRSPFYKAFLITLGFLLNQCFVDPTSAYANSYHIATTGSDYNAGTLDAPFQTIQKAVSVAKPGDVVYVHTGTYSGIRIYPATGMGSSGLPGQPIIYRTYGDGAVTIDGGAGAAIWIEGAYLEFNGFRLTAPLRDGQWGGIGVFLMDDTPGGSQTITSHHVKITNCEIVDCAHHGILGRGDDCEFSNLDVHHNGKDWFTNQGIYLSGSRNRILRNKIHDNATTGIQLWHSDPDADDVPNHTLVADNIIYANGFSGVTNDPAFPERNQYGRGIVLGSNGAANDGNIIQNNLIFANFPAGISLANLGANTKILNNTIVGNIIGLSLEDGVTGVIIKNNIVYGNSARAMSDWLQKNRPELLPSVAPNRHGNGLNFNAEVVNGGGAYDGYTLDYNLWDPGLPFFWKGVGYYSFSAYQSASGKDVHSLATDPKFQNAGDFHLHSTSPVIDAGMALPEITLANRGGNHFAASNYVLSYSLEDSAIWTEESEGTPAWSDLTGKLGVYVDDDANEYQQNGAEKWARVRVKLLDSALLGTWQINAFVWDRDKHQSALVSKNVNVVANPLTASKEITGALPQNGKNLEIDWPPSTPQNVMVTQ